MRAISFSSYGSADVLQLADLPLPAPGPGQVRVRTAATSVSPADWRLRAGQFRLVLRLQLPFVPGCDVAGVVEAVGPDVTSAEVGDMVFALQPTRIAGAYAEQVLVRVTDLAPAPRGLPLGRAAAVPLCGLTALQALERAGLEDGRRLLVHGAAGGVGTFAVQIARAMGADVTAVCGPDSRDVIAGLGAHRVLDRTRDDLRADAPYDIVFDAVNTLPFRRSRALLRPGGTAVSVNPFADRLAPDWLAWTRGGRRLRSVLVRPDSDQLARLAGWIEQGQLRPVIEHSYRLEEAAQAHRRSETGRVHGKLLLVTDPALADHVPGATERASRA